MKPKFFDDGYPCFPMEEEKDPCDCPNHPDLYLLRDAAADERGAIADYLECAFENPCFADLFLDAAEDEMQHYVEIMRLISLLDSVQYDMLKKDLKFLTTKRLAAKPKAWKKYQVEEEEDVQVELPKKKDLCLIRCLTKAIQDELHAINKYQRYMNKAEESIVKELFCDLMNEEKEHVAEFTAALFSVTREPLEEKD
ncbi:MAG: ferritin-like domain-containing protein [Sporomusaceae bacterium]|nr:ferritin-like domain-containing protein [Sporomusaceae bacterium]